MKIIRFVDAAGQIRTATPTDDGHARLLNGNFLDGFELADACLPVGNLLCPFEPSVVIGIGLNYREHAAETKAQIPQWPVVFYKNPASVIADGEEIVLPRTLRSDKVDYECELGVVIGKKCRNVTRETALEYVLGYTCANDVSARDWQKEWGGSQWSRAKSFDSFCPLGPALLTADEIPNPNDLSISTVLNGELVQDSNTADMIFDVPTLIEFLSGSTTLLPMTLILTGTPSGVGVARNPPRFLQPGDEVCVEIERIGRLRNRVVEESPRA